MDNPRGKPRKRWKVRKDDSIFDTFEELLHHRYWATPCETVPQLCEPREIKHVIWDADDTLWDVDPSGLSSFCEKPFKRIEKGVVEGSCDMLGKAYLDEILNVWRQASPNTIKLKPNTVETIERLNARGIKSSVASNNDPNIVETILEAMDVRDLFSEVVSGWQPKSVIIQGILNKAHVKGEETIFIDDNSSLVRQAQMAHNVLPLVMGQDIHSADEVFRYIKDI